MMKTIIKEAALSGTSLDGKFNFLLSNPFEEDGMGDIVGDETDSSYGWDLTVFRKNPANFWAHDTSQPPIARWENVGIRDGALRGTLVFPEKGIYPFADQIHALCRAGIIRGVSVGFRPTKSKPRANGGTHWLRMTLVEAPLCGIPALPSALMEAKQLGIPEDAIQKVFRMAPTPNKKKAESIGERIRRARRVVAKAKAIQAKTSNPKHRATLLKTIAILEAEDRERMAASIKPPSESREQKKAKLARSQGACASPAGRQ